MNFIIKDLFENYFILWEYFYINNLFFKFMLKKIINSKGSKGKFFKY